MNMSCGYPGNMPAFGGATDPGDGKAVCGSCASGMFGALRSVSAPTLTVRPNAGAAASPNACPSWIPMPASIDPGRGAFACDIMSGPTVDAIWFIM